MSATPSPLRNGELRGAVRELVEALCRHRQGMSNILEFRKLDSEKWGQRDGYGGRCGALTRQEIDDSIGNIDKALASARAILESEAAPVDYAAHLRKMLKALPAERAEELANVFLARYSDVVKSELRAYAEAAREAQEVLSDASTSPNQPKS